MLYAFYFFPFYIMCVCVRLPQTYTFVLHFLRNFSSLRFWYCEMGWKLLRKFLNNSSVIYLSGCFKVKEKKIRNFKVGQKLSQIIRNGSFENFFWLESLIKISIWITLSIGIVNLENKCLNFSPHYIVRVLFVILNKNGNGMWCDYRKFIILYLFSHKLSWIKKI